MKRKQVMAMLLALSLAAANVVTAPMDAYASISVAESVGSVGAAEGTETTVTLAADVADGSKIYISADDVKDTNTVTVAVDGETYEKIIYSATEPEDVNAFESASGNVELGSETFSDSKTVATLYLLPKSAENIGGMISVTVNIDNVEPTVGETFTVGGKTVKSAATLNASDVAEGAELVLSATTKDSGAVAISYAVGTEEKTATAEGMAGVEFTAYSDATKPKLGLAESANYVYVQLVDAVGNVAYACSAEITVDKTAPTITSVKVADNDVLTNALLLKAANPTLTVEAEQGATVTYALGDEEKNQEALKAYDSNINQSVTDGSASLTIADAEAKFIYIKAADAAGNASYACTKLVTIDATAPTLKTLTAAGSDATSSDVTVGAENPALVIEADDKTNVTISYTTGDTEISGKDDLEKLEYSQTYDAQEGANLTLANGAFTYVYVKLVDQAGNETYACSGKITVDTSAPDCTFTPTAEENATVINADNYEYNINEGNVKVAFAAKEGDTITSVTVDDQSNESAKTNEYATFDTAGEHTVEVALKHNANNNTATKTITVKCYKQVDVSAADTVAKTYGDSLAATDLYKNLNVNYTDPTPATVYIASEAESVENVKDSFGDAVTGLPTDVGTYWIKTTFPSKGYFLENSVYTKLTISKKSGVTASYNGTVTVQGSDTTTEKTVDLAAIVAPYKSTGDTLSYAVGEITGDGSTNVSATDADNGSVVTIKGNGSVDEDKDATIPVTVTGFKNYDSITVSIPVKVTQNAVADLEIVGASDKTYDGVAETAGSFSYKLDGVETTSTADGMTVKITKAEAGEVEKIDGVGTYTITASFSGESGGETKTGYATKTITVSKRPLTVTFANTEVTEGTDPASVTYPVAPNYTGLATGHTAAPTSELSLSSSYDAGAKAGATFAYTGCPENTGFKVTTTEAPDTDLSANYEITVQNGSVVVKAKPAEQSKPSIPSYSGVSSSGTPDKKDEDKKDENKTDTEIKTEESKITTNDKGETVIVDASGVVVKNNIVKIDGAKYITDENGVVIKSDFAKTPKGNLVYADADGKVVAGKTFSVNGKKYVAKKSGAIVTKAFTKTAKGNTVYSGKSGAIVTNKAFKVDGKTYVAKKSGAIVKSAWVKIGNKKYYCNKNGVVTKTKKVK
ncbi:MAG: hypothetical protein PUK75_11865 [bacterium]|nr:hypothetical protein [bacterium]MDY4100379.1 hypothetical protein [Lachnospiraceae bacterium]